MRWKQCWIARAHNSCVEAAQDRMNLPPYVSYEIDDEESVSDDYEGGIDRKDEESSADNVTSESEKEATWWRLVWWTHRVW